MGKAKSSKRRQARREQPTGLPAPERVQGDEGSSQGVSLFDQLVSIHGEERRNACEAFARLVLDDDSRNLLLQPEAVAALVSRLSDADAAVRVSAAGACRNIIASADTEGARLLVEEGAPIAFSACIASSLDTLRASMSSRIHLFLVRECAAAVSAFGRASEVANDALCSHMVPLALLQAVELLGQASAVAGQVETGLLHSATVACLEAAYTLLDENSAACEPVGANGSAMGALRAAAASDLFDIAVYAACTLCSIAVSAAHRQDSDARDALLMCTRVFLRAVTGSDLSAEASFQHARSAGLESLENLIVASAGEHLQRGVQTVVRDVLTTAIQGSPPLFHAALEGAVVASTAAQSGDTALRARLIEVAAAALEEFPDEVSANAKGTALHSLILPVLEQAVKVSDLEPESEIIDASAHLALAGVQAWDGGRRSQLAIDEPMLDAILALSRCGEDSARGCALSAIALLGGQPHGKGVNEKMVRAVLAAAREGGVVAKTECANALIDVYATDNHGDVFDKLDVLSGLGALHADLSRALRALAADNGSDPAFQERLEEVVENLGQFIEYRRAGNHV